MRKRTRKLGNKGEWGPSWAQGALLRFVLVSGLKLPSRTLREGEVYQNSIKEREEGREREEREKDGKSHVSLVSGRKKNMY